MRVELFPTIGTGIWKLNLTSAAMTVIAILIVLILARLAVKNINVRTPKGMQNVLEWLVDFITGLAKDTIGGERAKTWVPLAFTIIIYLFVSNQMGVVANFSAHIDQPILGVTPDQLEAAHKSGRELAMSFFNSPTANINVAMGMSVAIVLLTHIVGLRNPKNYFKHYVEPNPAFTIIHVLDEASKFLTLGLRLFGNIFAGEVLISVILTMPLVGGFIPVGMIPLVPWLGYSIFVGTIQAFIFTVLTLVYLGQKLPHDEHH
jgi:F-type H+-transporting ATPase subunit a